MVQDIQQIARHHKEVLQSEETGINQEIAKLSTLVSAFQSSMMALLQGTDTSEQTDVPALPNGGS